MQKTDLKWFSVRCHKVSPTDRDVAHSHMQDYYDVLAGGEDEDDTAGSLGQAIEYFALLAPDGVLAYEGASNLIALEEDIEVQLDTETPVQVAGQAALNAMRVPEAHAKGHRGQGSYVFVCDTGISQYRWQWLSDRKLLGFIGDATGEGVTDGNGHGTHCAGIVNQAAPEAKLGVIKVMTDDGNGTGRAISAGIRRAAKEGATQISLSLSGPASGETAMDRAVQDAVEAGASVYVSAGNNNQKSNADYMADGNSPAHERTAITVAAAGTNRSLASFSAGGKCVDISAVGVRVGSWDLGTGEKAMSGTSMACPYAAGIEALMPDATADKRRNAMLKTARDTPAPAIREGAGFVDAGAYVDMLTPEPEPKPTPKPKRTLQWKYEHFKRKSERLKELLDITRERLRGYL